MVSEKILRDTELDDNLIEYEMHGCLTISFNSGHSLYPFREIVNSHYNMMVPPSRSWVAIHKIDPPLSEGTGGDNGM